jgi:VanZ family protein
VVDEIHQSFVPGRQGAVADVLIDSVGVLAGVLLAVWWRR